jgi:hypothetical protein
MGSVVSGCACVIKERVMTLTWGHEWVEKECYVLDGNEFAVLALLLGRGRGIFQVLQRPRALNSP